VSGFGGRRDRRDGNALRNTRRRDHHRRPTEAVAHEELRRSSESAQMLDDREHVVHVRRERGVGESTVALPESGEIEPDDGDPALRETMRHATRSPQVLGRTERVREQAVRARTFRPVENRGELESARADDSQSLGDYFGSDRAEAGIGRALQCR
jgi:hypothetical protein